MSKIKNIEFNYEDTYITYRNDDEDAKLTIHHTGNVIVVDYKNIKDFLDTLSYCVETIDRVIAEN